MKIVYREVTINQPVYIAADGKEFDNEEACADYEFECFKKSFKCFNSRYEESDVESAALVYAPTETAVQHFMCVSDTLGLVADGVDKPGIYMYSDYGNSWVNLEEVLRRVREMIGGGTANEQP